MNGFTFVLFIVVIFIGLLCFLIYFLPSRLPDNQKGSPYECGFDPLNSARVPFSFRFFLVAILFLLFDLEIALLFPLPYSFSFLFGQFFVIFLSVFFISLLTVGLIYEWINGGLDWAD
nr:NADH dehydrogenase subunit 3 [Ptilometra sp. DH-R]